MGDPPLGAEAIHLFSLRRFNTMYVINGPQSATSSHDGRSDPIRATPAQSIGRERLAICAGAGTAPDEFWESRRVNGTTEGLKASSHISENDTQKPRRTI
jgi:hypothetical protein